jgi:teichuronic acid exporter
MMSDTTLRSKTIGGVGWSFADSGAKYGISFIVSIILARLLGPDTYGLIGIIMIFTSFFSILVDGGFTNAIIRKQDANDVDYSTVFWTNLFLSLALSVTLFFCAGYISEFFKRPELVALTRVMSSIVILDALCIVQRTKLTKKIDFKTQTIVSIISSSISGVVGIGMAVSGLGVWSLAGQQISSAFLNMIFLWRANRWLPEMIFSWQSFKEMWNFGWKLMVSGIFNTISNNIYGIVIGRKFSAATLGQYSRAESFAGLFSRNITRIVSRVSFTALCNIQDEPMRFKSAFREIVRTTMFPTFTLMLGIAAVAKPLIFILLGDKWTESAPFLQIICLYLMLNPMQALNLNAIQVMGRSDLTLYLNIFKTILSAGPILLGIFYNIYWMLFGSMVLGYFSLYLNTFFSKKLFNYSMFDQIKDIAPSLSLAFAMAVPVYAMSYLPISAYILLPIQIISGGTISYLLFEKTQLSEYIEIKKLVFGFVQRIKNN